MAATLKYTTLGYFSCVIAILGTLRPARSSIPERDGQLPKPSHRRRRRRRAPRAIHSGALRAARPFPAAPRSPYPVLGNMTFAVRNRGRQQRQRVYSDRLSFPPHLVPPQTPPRGPAPRSARTGCWKPDVAECACARGGPPRRSALVTTSPYPTVETGSLRKRRGRQLCPAPLAGSTVTIGLPPARRILGASPAACAFARPIKNSRSQGCVPLSAGSPFESCFRTWTLPWECFDSRTYLLPRANLGVCPAARPPSEAALRNDFPRRYFRSEAQRVSHFHSHGIWTKAGLTSRGCRWHW